MQYAEGRTYYDADSHIMELPDWLGGYVADEMRASIGPLRLGPPGAWPSRPWPRRPPAGPTATPGPSWRIASSTPRAGARWAPSTPASATRALDLLGFDRQLVFPTFAQSQFMPHDDPQCAGPATGR